jgi:hypothetical protein
MPRPKGSPNRVAGPPRRQVQLSLPELAIQELDYLCRRQAERDGIKPDRLRSGIVRRLIRQEFHRERAREEQEHQARGSAGDR